MSMMQASNNKAVRLGFVGLGARGVYHLNAALRMAGVEVAALCDVAEAQLQRAAKAVTASGRPAPKLYGRSAMDYERLCAEETLDAVICSTPPETHAAVCLAANKNGKNAASEGPLVLTIEDAWALVEAYEKTKKWSVLAETTLLDGEGGANLTLLNIVRQGLLGEMIHCEDGVLRGTRAGRAGELAAKLRGNLSPDAPMNRLIPLMDINRGDRFDSLMSTSSRAAALAGGSGKRYAGGDYNASIIHTVNGNLVTLNFDKSTPCPGGYCRLQGTKGVYMSAPGLSSARIYIDGLTQTPHQWESVDSYFQKYRHPLLRAAGANDVPLTWQRLVKALREGKDPDFDVYDSVTSSAVVALSDKSASNRSRPVEFPDFTRGKWKTRKPIDIA